MPSPLVIRARPELCHACFSCLVACAYAKLALPEDAPLRPDYLYAARLSIQLAGGYSVPVHCAQCASAPCLTVCPTGALQRAEPEGPIFSILARCIGCKYCVLACPMGVLSLDSRTGLVQKCDQCRERMATGRLPACVEHCPAGALEVVDLDRVIEAAAENCARQAAAVL
jgi:Fe-S-cluster-containing dehydrogenase component